MNGETVQLPKHSHCMKGMTPAGELQGCGPKVVSRSVSNASEQEQDAIAAQKSRGIAHMLLKTVESDKVYVQ